MSATQIAIVGGCGHVGLPLGIALASVGFKTTLIDVDRNQVEKVNRGDIGFVESENAKKLLRECLDKKVLVATEDKSSVADCLTVIFVPGTPIDEHLNPKILHLYKVIESYITMLEGKHIILRSTVYPGVAELVNKKLCKKLKDFTLSFCPERISQGQGLKEIFDLPQIISSTCERGYENAVSVFGKLTKDVVRLSLKEAELAKLMTNSWRYLEFAIANQFYMIAESNGLDFYKIYDAIRYKYGRASTFKSPGLTAGPCLLKDTMQLSSFYNSQFFLGHNAMLINEGMASFVIAQLESQIGSLENKNILLLGMTFKPDNDDIRESLSYKIKRELQTKLANVIVSDVYLPDSVPLEAGLKSAHAVILGVPHREYIDLKIKLPYVDCWGVWRERSDYFKAKARA